MVTSHDALEMFHYCEYSYHFLYSCNVIIWILIWVYAYSAYNKKKAGYLDWSQCACGASQSAVRSCWLSLCTVYDVSLLTDYRHTGEWLVADARYIKATRPVLEILKMAGYFLDSPCKWGRMQIGLHTIHTDQKLMHTIQVPAHSQM
jgi:hypothetical protein